MKSNSVNLLKLFGLCIACIFILPPSISDAENGLGRFQDEMQDDEGVDEIERVKEFCIELKRQAIMGQMSMQIDSLKQLLKLEESQIKKLSIVAKAVSGKEKEQWAKIIGEYEMWGEIAESMAGELDSLEEADMTDFSKLPADTLYYMELTDLGYVSPGPTKNKFWLKSLKSVLNEEQTKIYEEDLAKRDKKSLGVLVDYVVENFARELVLNDEARQAVTKFVESKLNDPPIRSEYLAMYSEVINLAMSRLAVAELDELESALSQVQLNRLRTLLAVYGPNGFMFVDEQDFDDAATFFDDDEGEESVGEEAGDDEAGGE